MRFLACAILLMAFSSLTLLHPSLSPLTDPKERESVKIINAHMRIKDFQSAQEEALEALNHFPHSNMLWEVYIKVLSKLGNDKEMVLAWKNYVDVFPEEKENHALIETLAWGIIENASHSSTPVIRVMALLSAYLSQDAKGIEIIKKYLKDPNSSIRRLTVELSANLRDECISEELLRIFKEETVWNVRLEAIRSLGGMKLRKAQGELLSLLQNSKIHAEETAVLIEALVNLWEKGTGPEVSRLVRSNRAGLRLLACQVVAHFEMKNEIDLILPLLNDHNAEVRMSALWVLGYLRITHLGEQSVVNLAKEKMKDRDPLVRLKAAWLLTINDPLLGQAEFKKLFKHRERDVRIMTAAHLAACGQYAFPLISEQFQSSKEPYERMNLAFGLLGQRRQTELACQALYEGLQQHTERWAWDEINHVRALVPSKLRQMDDLSISPETKDKITRLEILNILAVMKFAQAQEAIKSFLQEKTWGITAMAAATLLTEGDEAALELVKYLLHDPEPQVRVQAALILALWGGGEEALDILSKTYPLVDREMKERILEGIIKIATPQSISFLLERLQEPYQSLRVIAAAGLILCLNR